ncbi:MAG: ABC transporter permease [Chryseolinea sp.]
MTKNKVFIVINVLGMGIAIATCIVAYFAYQYDNDFDVMHQNRQSIYRISSVRDFDNMLTRFGTCPLPLGEIMSKTFPEVKMSTRLARSSSNFKREENLFAANLTYVDPDFFKMFSFDFIAGNGESLTDNTSVVISESIAIKLFSSEEKALGKAITQVYGKELKELKITGVFREQETNSSFHIRNGSAFLNFENHEDEFPNASDKKWTSSGTLFAQIDGPASVSLVQKQLQSYTANNNKVREDFQVKAFELDSFTSMAHHDRDLNVQAETWGAPPQAAIVGSMIMGALILLIACFNLTNTAIAMSARRIKEIGIRKVMGSMRGQLVVQFLGETTAVCLLALFVGLGIADLLTEGWNMMTSNNIHLEPHYLENPGFIGFLIGVLFLTGILAGSYPAFYITKFRPASILKGKLTLGGTNYFTRTLLGMQFVISLITIVSAIGFLQNARYQREYDLGFDVRGSVVAWISDRNEFDIYRNALQNYPEAISVAGAKSSIFSNRAHEPIKYESLQADVDIIEVGDHYISTMDLKVEDGREFIKDSETDRQESIIITQKLANVFGWGRKAIGKEVIYKDSVKLHVVGVVKDVYTQGLWREMEPMMIRYVLPEQYSMIVVNAKSHDVASLDNFMNQQWNKIFPSRLYNGYKLSSATDDANALNMNIVYGYAFLGAIAMLLSATGLYTLVSLNMIRRMKEIGIRKIVGASVSNISRTVNTEFIVIVSIAAVLGSWAGFAWCNTIMGAIWKYYQGVNVITFCAAISVLAVICVGTIGYKVFSIASMNPVKTLRDE